MSDDTIKSSLVAGVGSVCIQETAEAVFQAGGSRLLSEGAQQGLKIVAEPAQRPATRQA